SDGRAVVGGVPDRSADAEPDRRRRHLVVRRHHALRVVGRSRRVRRPRSLRRRHRRRVRRAVEAGAAEGARVSELWESDAWELADGVRRGELKSTEVLELFLARIEQFDGELNAFCHLDLDGARAAAAEVDAAVARGDDPGAWAGVPMGVKELAQVEGWP